LLFLILKPALIECEAKMTNITKTHFLQELEQRFGRLEKFGESLSLFKIKGTDVSHLRSIFKNSRTATRRWVWVKKSDLELLQGYRIVDDLLFYGINKKEPLLIPYADYEKSFDSITQLMMVSIRCKSIARKPPQNCILHALGVL